MSKNYSKRSASPRVTAETQRCKLGWCLGLWSSRAGSRQRWWGAFLLWWDGEYHMRRGPQIRDCVGLLHPTTRGIKHITNCFQGWGLYKASYPQMRRNLVPGPVTGSEISPNHDSMDIWADDRNLVLNWVLWRPRGSNFKTTRLGRGEHQRDQNY